MDCARLARLGLDDWQEFVLMAGLAQTRGERWAAREVGCCVPRQNGKGEIILALELYWLFVLEEKLIVHSAHLFDTSKEAMRRLIERVEGVPEFSRRVKRVVQSHGEEGVELRSGARIRFKTRTKGGGRGLSAPKLIFDEAMYAPDEVMGALMPLMSAQPDGQMWYFGSAVDQLVHQDGRTFARVRERGLEEDPSLCWFEWSSAAGLPDELSPQVWDDREAWAAANPAYGVRITEQAVEAEQRQLPRRTFAVERLGVGDWPRSDQAADTVFDLDTWDALADASSSPGEQIVFAFDVAPDRANGSIAVASKRTDGLYHIEVVNRRAGTGWIAGRVAELYRNHRPQAILCDSMSPAASLVKELEALGVEVELVNGHDQAQACGVIHDAVVQGTLRHLGTPELESAVRGAAKRPLGDAWAWSRKNSSVDISPLVACTLALWKALHEPEPFMGVAFA